MTDYAENLYEAIPPGKRTARAMVYLVEATRQARQDVSQRVAAYAAENNESRKIKRELYKELRRLKDRLDEYAKILADADPDGPIPEGVRPLFFKFATPPTATDGQNGQSYPVPTPDAFTPRMLATMLGALKDHDASMKNVFWKYVWENVKSLPGDAAEVIHDAAADVVENLLPEVEWQKWAILVGAGVVTLGGVYVVASQRKGPR